jgi:hypothetical protein
MHLANALILVAENFVTLAPECRAMFALLDGQPGGLSALPASVLAAGLEALAFGSGLYQRRLVLVDACILLQGRGAGVPGREDFAAAVGVWGAALARAAQLYRGRAVDSSLPGRQDTAAPTAALLTTLTHELGVLTQEAERRRHLGRAGDIAEVRARVKNGDCGRTTPKPSGKARQRQETANA